MNEAVEVLRKLTRREREALRTGLYFGADLRAKLVAKGLLTLKTVSMGGVKPIETPLAREICKILRERDD